VGTDTIRILVLREMPAAEHNVVWNLFSGDPERIVSAFQRLQPRLQSWSSTLNLLLNYYGSAHNLRSPRRPQQLFWL
jgi:hypothetical protein